MSHHLWKHQTLQSILNIRFSVNTITHNPESETTTSPTHSTHRQAFIMDGLPAEAWELYLAKWQELWRSGLRGHALNEAKREWVASYLQREGNLGGSSSHPWILCVLDTKFASTGSKRHSEEKIRKLGTPHGRNFWIESKKKNLADRVWRTNCDIVTSVLFEDSETISVLIGKKVC